MYRFIPQLTVVVAAMAFAAAGSARAQGTVLGCWGEGPACLKTPVVQIPPGPHLFTAVATPSTDLDRFFVSRGETSRQAAETRAMSDCLRVATACKPVGWAEEGCVVVVEDRGKNRWWASSADFSGPTDDVAQKNCRQAGGTNCVVVAHPCSRG